jgi:hypothetical protein
VVVDFKQAFAIYSNKSLKNNKMKLFGAIAAVLTAIVIFTACQKQINFDTSGISSGTLKSDATGDCLPSSVNGVYKVDSVLTSSEYIDVNVSVDSLGTYTITSDTLNGFSFKGTGTFGKFGDNLVRLYGSGKPVAAGDSIFTVKYGTSSCKINVLTLGANTGSAIYTLGGAGSTCSGFALGVGSYVAGTPLVAANSVTTTVNVSQTGTYTLGTDTVNGIWFRTSNNFTSLGNQSITLTGIGTPAAAGTFNYTLTNGSTSCIFSITVTGTGGTPSGDYFPLTANSWWSYDDNLGGTPQPDTSYISIIGTKVYNSNTYTQFEISSPAGVPADTTHYRKSGNDYFEWAPSDSYSEIQFDNTVYVDINFLKINAVTNTTWSSAVYSGTILGGNVNIRYDYKIENASTSVVVNGITYTDVIKVSQNTMQSNAGAPYFSAVLHTFYYAKGIGIVKAVATDVATGISSGSDIRHYHVL